MANLSQKTFLSAFYQFYIKRSDGVEPGEKKRNAPMAKKKQPFFNQYSRGEEPQWCETSK